MLPWENGTFLPWMVGQTFYKDGVAYQVYPEGDGYTIKRTDANGTSYMTGPSPNDLTAQAQWFENSPYGQRIAAAERAGAAQNEFNRGITSRQVGVSEAQQRNTASYQAALVQQAKDNLAWQMEQGRAQLGISRDDLALRGRIADQQFMGTMGNLGLGTAQLGASLRGPRDLWAYDRAAAATSSNPILANAVSTWANMTNNRPTGMGSWQGGNPERMTLGALANDFGGFGMGATPGSVSAQSGGGKQETLRALDEIARSPNQAAPNWWNTLNDTQQKIALGGWDELGHDPSTVLARLGYGQVRQGVGSTRAA